MLTSIPLHATAGRQLIIHGKEICPIAIPGMSTMPKNNINIKQEHNNHNTACVMHPFSGEAVAYICKQTIKYGYQ